MDLSGFIHGESPLPLAPPIFRDKV
jgi:hypothetical protein